MTDPSMPPDASTAPTWPEPGKPLPPAATVLAPLLELFGALFKVAKRKDAPPAASTYRGFPVRLDTCDDPTQLFGEDHVKLRAARALPFASALELVFLVAFQLGAEHARRSMRQRAAGGGGPAGGQPRVRAPRARRGDMDGGRFW